MLEQRIETLENTIIKLTDALVALTDRMASDYAQAEVIMEKLEEPKAEEPVKNSESKNPKSEKAEEPKEDQAPEMSEKEFKVEVTKHAKAKGKAEVRAALNALGFKTTNDCQPWDYEKVLARLGAL